MVKLSFNPKTEALDIICNQLGCTPGDSDQAIIFRNFVLQALRRKLLSAHGDKEKILEALTMFDSKQFKMEKTSVENGNIIIEYSMIIE